MKLEFSDSIYEAGGDHVKKNVDVLPPAADVCVGQVARCTVCAVRIGSQAGGDHEPSYFTRREGTTNPSIFD